MRLIYPGLTAALALAALGCAGGPPTSPLTTDTTTPAGLAPEPALGALATRGDIAQSALALYEITLDPSALAGSATLVAKRASQANDDVTDLGIDGFLTADSFNVESVSRGAGTIDVTYSFTHPYDAPTSLTPPGSLSNRADLGAVVRVVFLVEPDGSEPTFFPGQGDLTLNTDLITNPSGYLNPGLLLDTTGFTADLFPYQLLVDEVKDNREGVTNGADTRGNFDDDSTGWQSANIDNAGINNGWTGYDFIHQGQRALNVVSFDEAALGSGPQTLTVALIASYGQPKAAKPSKLPAQPADVLTFGYRAPHVSPDVSAIEYVGESGGLIADAISATTLTFRIRDWDASATETTELDLSTDPDASRVSVGESGPPEVLVSIPDLLSGSAGLNDAPTGTGLAGDELVLTSGIAKGSGSGEVAGTYTGLVKVIDAQSSGGATEWHRGLGPGMPTNTVQVSPLEATTYQVFRVVLAPGVPLNQDPILSLATAANVLSGDTTTLDVVSASDTEGDDIIIEIDWDNDTIFEDTQTLISPYAPVTYSSTVPAYNNSSLTPAPRTIPVRFRDTQHVTNTVYAPALGFTLGANRPPQISGTPVLQDPSLIGPATFIMTAGTAGFIDPEGNAITLKVTNSVNATVATSATLPIGGLGPFANPPVTTVDFTLWATDTLHPGTGAGPVDGSAFPVVTGTVQAPCVPTTQIYQYTFAGGSQTSSDGWMGGHVFTPAVFNSDNAPGNSRFYKCNAKAYQGAGFAGGHWTTGPWALTGCGLSENDYGTQMDNSVISATLDLSTRTDANLIFNSSKNGRPGTFCRYRILISTDNGATWPAGNVLYDTNKAAAGVLNETDVTVNLQAYCGMNNLRLRFQCVDPTASSFSAASGTFAGWSFDNVRINACP